MTLAWASARTARAMASGPSPPRSRPTGAQMRSQHAATSAEDGGGFGYQEAAAVPRAEQTEVSRVQRKDTGEQLAVLLVACGHQDDGVFFAMGKMAGEKRALGFGKAIVSGELCATIGNGDVPAEEGSHAHERLGVVSRAEYPEALCGNELFDVAAPHR